MLWWRQRRRFNPKALLDENGIYLLDENGNPLTEE